MSVPRRWDQLRETWDLMAGTLAERPGRSAAGLKPRSFAATVPGVRETAVIARVVDGGRGDLLEMLDRGRTLTAADRPR